MIDIHVIQSGNAHLYRRELDEHHRVRRDIYIGENGWRGLREVDGREIDQFDTETTTYVLGLDEAGRVACGSRLHPSTGPTLLNAVFPALASSRGLPRSPTSWEWTRFFVTSAHRGRRVSGPMAGAICCGVLGAALDEAVDTLTIVSESFWLARFSALGWRLEILGEPFQHEEFHLVAFSFPVDGRTLESTRASYAIPMPAIRRDGARRGLVAVQSRGAGAG